jgi:hypothetical protein
MRSVTAFVSLGGVLVACFILLVSADYSIGVPVTAEEAASVRGAADCFESELTGDVVCSGSHTNGQKGSGFKVDTVGSDDGYKKEGKYCECSNVVDYQGLSNNECGS